MFDKTPTHIYVMPAKWVTTTFRKTESLRDVFTANLRSISRWAWTL